MSRRWGRIGASARLLLAIFGDLRRRAWWAYRTGTLHGHQPRTTIVAPRPTGQPSGIPTLTSTWRPAAARALPVGELTAEVDDTGVERPAVWIDVSARPDIADLPRVLRDEQNQNACLPVMANQWLADPDARRIILVVTYLEPVNCTWTLSFDMPRCMALLQHVTQTGELVVMWQRHGPVIFHPSRLSDGVLLPISRPVQLYAILTFWKAHNDIS